MDPPPLFPQPPPSNLPGSAVNGVSIPASASASASASAAVKKRRGRPPKPKHDAFPAAVPVFAHPVDTNDAPVADVSITSPAPARSRGRPRKSSVGNRPQKVGATRVASPGGATRRRGRQRKNPRKPMVEGFGIASAGALPVFGGAVAAPVGVKRRGRPPKAGGVVKKPRKLSGKPLGRPKKAADSQLPVAYLDLKAKLENLQSRVKQTVTFVRPYLNNDEVAISAMQELEYAATNASVASYPESQQP